MPAPNKPTGRLHSLATSATQPPEIYLVRRLVREGAVVNWKPLNGPPTLWLLAQHRHIEALLACLETSQDIDFSPSDPNTREGDEKHQNHLHFLHALCDLSPVAVAVGVLEAVVRHIELHPRDTVKWDGFLPCAARSGCLSAFYRVVQDIPYYADRTEKSAKIELSRVTPEDWEGLPEEDKKLFAIVPIVSLGSDFDDFNDYYDDYDEYYPDYYRASSDDWYYSD